MRLRIFTEPVTVCCGVDEAEINLRADRMGQPVDAIPAYGACGTAPLLP